MEMDFLEKEGQSQGFGKNAHSVIRRDGSVRCEGAKMSSSVPKELVIYGGQASEGRTAKKRAD